MPRLKSKARMLVCLVLIVAFFLPSYRTYSGYGFISLALMQTDPDSQLTLTDSLIAILPLLLVPATAAMLLLRSVQRIPVRRVYVTLPLLFLIFFTGILFWGERTNPAVRSLADLFRQMDLGFYLAYLCCVTLPFTRNRRRRRHRKPVEPQTNTELAV